MSKIDFIKGLHKKRSTFIDPDQAEMIANLLDTISSDIYSESQRFIFELIQNADDAGLTDGNEIHFDFYSTALIVSHKGKSFDEADIEGITNAGKGTKGSDVSKTGYKGIGFKSVFGKSNKVTILSDGYSFRFDRALIKQSFNGIKMPWQIIPIWTDSSDIDNDINVSILKDEFNVSTIIELENAPSLENELTELLSNGKILLFLRSITKLFISSNGILDYKIEKNIHKINESHNEVNLLKNDNELSSWIITTFDKIQINDETQIALKQDEKTPDKLKEVKFTEISFAAKIENGKLKEIKGEESLIFTYLPTKEISFEFPFLVNGNFLTSASRESIHEDRVWNQWLFNLLGEKIFDWFELISRSKYKFQLLHLLPKKYNGINNRLRTSFNKSFDINGKTKCFIPNKTSQLKRAPEILIDKTGLSEQDFIPTDAITEYINRGKKENYNVSSFVHPKLELKHKLNSLGAYTFDLENLDDFFIDDIFTANHQPSQNFSLIKYFFEKADYSDNKELNERLKSIPFIYAQGNILKSPQTICFPSISFETESGESVSVIHSEVYPKIELEPKVKSWLELLGIKEPSNLAYIENELIGNIDNCITIDNYKKITRYLLNQHKKGLLSESHYKNFEDLLLFTIGGGLEKAKNCYLSDLYEPSLKLEKIYKAGTFISNEYKEESDLSSEWKTFFLKIGVSENICVKKIKTTRNNCNNTIEDNYFVEVGADAKQQATTNEYHPHLVHNSNTIDLDKITFSEFADKWKFSKVFWKQVFSNVSPNSIPQSAKLFWGYFGSSWEIQNYFFWSLKNSKKFPTISKEVLLASEVFINTKEIVEIAGKYLPVLDCEIIPNEDWLHHIPFKHKLEINDCLKIIKAIGLAIEKDEEIKNANKNKLGLVYNKLSSIIPNLSTIKKNIIKEWANSHKLLCVNGSFENVHELKWVKIDNFINTSEHLKLLFIPENCKTNTNDFEELLELFGVQIIDSFILDIKNKEPNVTLKIQLQSVLPYLTAILERKLYLDYSVEFNRISTIIENTEFYNASEIVLSFKNQDEIVLGPSLDAYFDNSELSFKSKWTSPDILYALIPELLKLFKISGLNEELQVLLQLKENKIEKWLTKQGYEIDAIKENPEYEVAVDKAKLYKDEHPIEENPESLDVSIIHEYNDLNKLMKSKNISVEQLIKIISNYDADAPEREISISSKEHLDQKGKNEENRVARELVYKKLTSEGFEFTDGMGENSVVNGVYKGDIEYPLVVKSYRSTSYKFNIRPNEWIQLSRRNAMFWVHRGNGRLEVLNLEGLLRANSEFHVQFETEAFSFDALVKFAEVFRFVKNVHFQLDAPHFTIAKAFEEYKFDKREKDILEKGSDNQELLH